MRFEDCDAAWKFNVYFWAFLVQDARYHFTVYRLETMDTITQWGYLKSSYQFYAISPLTLETSGRRPLPTPRVASLQRRVFCHFASAAWNSLGSDISGSLSLLTAQAPSVFSALISSINHVNANHVVCDDDVSHRLSNWLIRFRKLPAAAISPQYSGPHR